MKEHNNKVIENKYIDEIWTYNRFDAQKYNLKYNPQFYLKKCELSNSKINSDVLFVGRDKGREKDINEIKEKLKSKNIITTFRGDTMESIYGKILHLDGDKKYSDKELKYYQ